MVLGPWPLVSRAQEKAEGTLFSAVPPCRPGWSQVWQSSWLGFPGCYRWKALSNCGSFWVCRPTRNPSPSPSTGWAPTGSDCEKVKHSDITQSPGWDRREPCMAPGVGPRSVEAADYQKEIPIPLKPSFPPQPWDCRASQRLWMGPPSSPPGWCLGGIVLEHTGLATSPCRVKHTSQEKTFPLESPAWKDACPRARREECWAVQW